MINLFICSAVNEDIIFLSSIYIKKKASKKDMVLAVDGSLIANANLLLSSYPASSFYQIKNLLICLRFFISNRFKWERCYILNPNPINIFNIILLKLVGIKITSVIHDVEPHYSGLRGWIYGFQNLIMRKFCDELVVYSQYSKVVLERMGIKKTSLISIENLRTPAENSCINIPVEKKYDFIWWGRPESYKGIKYLEGFSELCLKKGCSFLVLSPLNKKHSDVGGRLSKFVNVTYIDERVSNEELFKLVASSRVNVCPYISATQSGIVSFCAALGVPTIAFDVGAMSEQLDLLKCGLIVENMKDVRIFEYLNSLTVERQIEIKMNYYKVMEMMG